MFAHRRNHSRLKKFAFEHGASIFGVADIGGIRDEFEFSADVVKRFRRAVCFGVGLAEPVLAEISDQPTKLYYHHYRTANMFLDQLAFALAQWIQQRGYSALPVPASQITDWQKQSAHLSHKKIGYLAGLGWIGRNNLLVTESYGSQFRLATVLTDMPMKAGKPLLRGCGRCFECVGACPVAAIQEEPGDFKHLACFEKLKAFQKQNIVGQFICGICVKACKGRGK